MKAPDTARVVHIAVVSNGQVLVVRRSTTDSLPDYWEIPGGSVEPGESFENAAKRDLEEETAIRAESLTEILRLSGPAPPGFNRPKIEASVFRLAAETRPPVRLLPNEHSDYRWVLLEDLRQLRMMDINRSMAILACAFLRSSTLAEGERPTKIP
jgi:8-oxo-dGTP diphosphatase